MSRSRQPATRSSLHTTTEPPQGPSTHLPQTIRLRGDNTTPTTTSPDPPSSRRIQWSEDVIDNEGMGKKSSKVCCIYHKARPVGESSSEESSSSSSSDSDSDSEAEQRRQRLSRVRGRGRRDADRPEGEGQEGEGEGEGCCSGEHHHSRSQIKRRKPSPNAYEKMPKPSKNHGRGV